MSEHVTNWLSAYHDGELKGRQRRQVEAHLAECASCRGELDQLRSLSATLAASPPPADLMPPEQFVAQVGLRLPRRPARTAPQRALLAAWWLVPLVLLGAWVFLQALLIVTELTEFALDLGLGGETVAAFLPAESGSLWQGLRLNLLLSGLIGLAYLSWLASWWSRRQHLNNESKNGRSN